MARCGNHGRVIPRDPELMHRLYWVENRSLPEIGAIFGVNHKSIERVFRELNIPRRKVGHSRNNLCACGKPAHKVRHAINGSLYGKLCRECRRSHYNKLAREYVKKPEVKAKRDRYMEQWYVAGSLNPTGEKQWLVKGKHYLRNARRHLRSPPNRAASNLRNAVCELVRSLQT